MKVIKLTFLKLSIILILFIFIVQVNADYSDCNIYGNCKTTVSTSTSTVNYSLVNVNNSDLLDNIDSTGFCQVADGYAQYQFSNNNFNGSGSFTITNGKLNIIQGYTGYNDNTGLFIGNGSSNISIFSAHPISVGSGIKWGSGSKLVEQNGALKRMIYTPNGDRFEVLNEAGSQFIFTVAGTSASWGTRLVSYETLIISNRSDYSVQSAGIPFPRQSLVVQNNLYVGINNTGDGSGVYINRNMTINSSLKVNDNITATGNITANYFFGDGSLLTNLASGSADGTGGWINDSLNTNTTLNVRANTAYINNIYESMNDLLSISPSSRGLYTVAGTPSIFWQSGEIYAPLVGALSIQYDNRYLADTSEVASVKWDDRTLNEGDGDITLDWENNLLKSDSVTILDWSSFGNFGSNAITCGALTSTSQATLSTVIVNGNITTKDYLKINGNVSVNGYKGITKEIKIIEDVDLLGMTKTFCNQTFMSGIITNTTCGSSEIENITFIATNCSGTDKAKGINSTGGVVCSADQTGASSSRNIYYTNAGSRTTNTTGLTFVNLFTIPISANTNYTLDCYLTSSSNVTTSGIRINMSLPGVPKWQTSTLLSTLTAAGTVQLGGCDDSLQECMPTAVTASILYPSAGQHQWHSYIENGATAGNIKFQFSGELASLKASIHRGSYCELKSI